MNEQNPEEKYIRSIRSFVLRQGHLTTSQAQALQELMPKWGIPFEEKKLNLNDIFQRPNPKILEIGFGMGTATAEIAQRLPENDFIGIEVHSPGVGNLLKLIENHHLTNIRIIHHDAVEVLQYMIADCSLHGVHIFFPDPWHKKRHHKRRLIQPAFIDSLIPKISSGGYIHVATDWEDYANQILEVLSSNPNLHNTCEQFALRPNYRPETKFEKRGIRLGHQIWDLIFEVK